MGRKGKRHVPHALSELVAPHVHSYNHFVEHGLRAVVDSLAPAYLYPNAVRAAVRTRARARAQAAAGAHARGGNGNACVHIA